MDVRWTISPESAARDMRETIMSDPINWRKGSRVIGDLSDYLLLLDSEIHSDAAPVKVREEADYALKLLSGKDFAQWHVLFTRMMELLEDIVTDGAGAFLSSVSGWRESVKDLWAFNNQAPIEGPKMLHNEEDIRKMNEIFVEKGGPILQAAIDWFETFPEYAGRPE